MLDVRQMGKAVLEVIACMQREALCEWVVLVHPGSTMVRYATGLVGDVAGMGISELREVVLSLGGDVDGIMEKAKQDAMDTMEGWWAKEINLWTRTVRRAGR